MYKKIRIGKDEMIFEGRFITIVHRHYIGSHGKSGAWEMVKRKAYGPIVVICAITEDEYVILEENYRVPLKTYVIEFPAGLMDRRGESPARLAARELLEETGYRAKKITKVMQGPFNPGLTDDEIAVYLATGAKKVAEPTLENGEDIKLRLVPLKKLYRFLMHPPRGMRVDLKTLSILYFLKERGYHV